MIVSLHKKHLPLTVSVGALALALLAAPSFAQETQAQSSGEREVAGEQATPVEQRLTEQPRRERYYLGQRPRLQRQQGPALGKPKSILPQPYVPKGSIVVPPAPMPEQTEAEQTGIYNETQQVALAEQNDGTPSPADILTSTAETDIGGDAAVGQSADEQFLEVGALESLDPSGVAILSEGAGYPLAFWDGKTRAEVAAGYGAYAGASGSRALAGIAQKIALSGATLPKPQNDTDVLAIIQARLALLKSLGDHEGYVALLERLPVDRDWSALVKDFTNKHLLKGELNDACTVAERQRVTDNDPYWLRLAAFCEAARGNRNGVDFQLGILEEVSEVQPTFYQLIDQIVVEASQAPGTIVPEAAALSNSLKVDLLEATMARLARAKVPLLALDGVNPLAAHMILALPNVERDAKIDLMGLAVRQGWLDTESLTAFAMNHRLLAGEMEAAIEALVDDGRFVIDAALVHISSDAEAGAMRVDALQKLWVRALQQRIASVAAGGYLGVTQDITPNPETEGVVAVLARAALVSGDAPLATRWFTALRAENAGETQIDRDLIALAPLLMISGAEGAPTLTADQLKLWWQGEAEREDRFARAGLLFTVMEALGYSVSEDCWAWLEDGPSVFSGGTPSAALWRGFLMAVQQQDVPKALAKAFALMSDQGPARVPAALAGSLIGGLKELGLEAEARGIATEMLIGQGL